MSGPSSKARATGTDPSRRGRSGDRCHDRRSRRDPRLPQHARCECRPRSRSTAGSRGATCTRSSSCRRAAARVASCSSSSTAAARHPTRTCDSRSSTSCTRSAVARPSFSSPTAATTATGTTGATGAGERRCCARRSRPHCAALDADARRVAIGGISMGGFGALDLARLAPRRFCAVGAHSPALWFEGGDTPAGAFDDAEDFARHDVIAAARARRVYRVPVWIDVGRDDPFAEADRTLASALRAHGTRVAFHLHGGGHGGWTEPHAAVPALLRRRVPLTSQRMSTISEALARPVCSVSRQQPALDGWSSVGTT